MAFGKETPPEVGAATQWKPGERPAGAGKPKGSKHITTHIQELMEDEGFEANVLDAKRGMIEYKGAPIKAIIQVAITKAVNGDAKAMDWLAKYGWSQKVEHANDPDNPLTNVSTMSKNELEDAIRNILGSSAPSSRALRDGAETSEG